MKKLIVLFIFIAGYVSGQTKINLRTQSQLTGVTGISLVKGGSTAVGVTQPGTGLRAIRSNTGNTAFEWYDYKDTTNTNAVSGLNNGTNISVASAGGKRLKLNLINNGTMYYADSQLYFNKLYNYFLGNCCSRTYTFSEAEQTLNFYDELNTTDILSLGIDVGGQSFISAISPVTFYGTSLFANEVTYNGVTQFHPSGANIDVTGDYTLNTTSNITMESSGGYIHLNSPIDEITLYAPTNTIFHTAIFHDFTGGIQLNSYTNGGAGGMLKTSTTGAVQIATPDVDYVDPHTTYNFRALITQLAPVVSANSLAAFAGSVITGGMPVTVTSYAGGDNFANICDTTISGTWNTSGWKFIATGGAPTDYTHASTLDYDGDPFITSKDTDGNYNPIFNTFPSGDITFNYSAAGKYEINSAGALFAAARTDYYFRSIIPGADGTAIFSNYNFFWGVDWITTSRLALSNDASLDAALYNQPIQITVYK